MSAANPSAVARYLKVAYPHGLPEAQTVLMEARGRFRRRPLPWLPMQTAIRLRPGVERVADLFVRFGRVTVMHVLDAYVDGRGITKVIGSADVGPEIDQGAFHAMLAEVVLFPTCWSQTEGLAWEAVDEQTADVRLPFRGGVEVATVEFDRSTGLPSLYRAARHKGAGGPKVDWQIDMGDWQRTGPLAVPRRLVVTWSDDPGPWLDMRLTSVTRDVDIGPAVERVRTAIAKAARSRND